MERRTGILRRIRQPPPRLGRVTEEWRVVIFDFGENNVQSLFGGVRFRQGSVFERVLLLLGTGGASGSCLSSRCCAIKRGSRYLR